MTEIPPLEDAEALRLLWDNVLTLDHLARQHADLAGRLTHTVRRFAETVVLPQEPAGAADPRHLLLELGAVLELGNALERTQGALEEALGSLSFAWAPNPARVEEIQTRELTALRDRLQARSRARWRPRGAGGRGDA